MNQLIFIYAGVLAAHFAIKDYGYIIQNDPIKHGWAFWMKRAAIFVIPCSVLILFKGMISLGIDLIGGGAYFSIMHRMILNALRLLPTAYISPSNGYDRFFLAISAKWGGHLAYVVEMGVMIFASWL